MSIDGLVKTTPPYTMAMPKGGEGIVYVGHYVDGMLALKLYATTGEPLMTATVCLAPFEPKTGRHVWIKDYSENEGIAKALQTSNIIQLTGHTVTAGFAEALEAIITDEFYNALPQVVRTHIDDMTDYLSAVHNVDADADNSSTQDT